MNRTWLGLTLLTLLSIAAAPSSAATILLDFGTQKTTTDASSRVWNNITDNHVFSDTHPSSSTALVDTTGAATGATATVTWPFFYHDETNGRSATGYPDSATDDSLYITEYGNGWRNYGDVTPFGARRHRPNGVQLSSVRLIQWRRHRRTDHLYVDGR